MQVREGNGSTGRALIVGGGIGGLSAACALMQAGWQVSLFERAPAFGEVGAGLTLWTNAVNALKHLGLADEVVAAGGRMCVGEVRDWRGNVLSTSGLDHLEERFGAPTICVHRADLVAILAARLPPAALHLGTACTGFTQNESGVTLTLEDGRQERGNVLVGADGLHSVIRDQLLGPAPPRYAGYTAWRAVAPFHRDSLSVGYTSETWGCGKRFGMVPLGKGRVYWFATEKGPQDQSGSAPMKADLQARFGDWHEPIPALLEATQENAILGNAIFDRDPASVWGQARVTLLGDAIHPTTPNLGQGACQAIEDAVMLARCLKEQADVDQALRTYEAMRRKRTAQITLLSRRFGSVSQASHPLVCRLRNALVRITPARLMQKQMDAIVGYNV
jgi:2-polyprenyl-6-methoxyphenol hydroxylase-like FAD-dependent oxidoreductase